MMRRIIRVHFKDLDETLMENAITAFYQLRDIDAVEKKPATRELINWIRALTVDPDFKPKRLVKGELPYLGVLFKKSGDLERANQTVRRRRLF